MAITLLPVYSKVADIQDVPLTLQVRVPPDLHLLQHQVQTYNALTAGDVDVVINIAMTGDGKSLAAQLPTLIDNRGLMGMYPTNQLIRDQEHQFEQTRVRWSCPNLGVTRLDAHRLVQLGPHTWVVSSPLERSTRPAVPLLGERQAWTNPSEGSTHR